MKYRQWKKNYKKKHGYNPPFEEDKRQQAKAVKRAIRKIPENTSSVYSAAGELAKSLAPALLNAMGTFFDALSEAFNRVGKVAGEMADNYRTTAAVYNEKEKER